MFHNQKRAASRIITVMLASTVVVGAGLATTGAAFAAPAGAAAGSGITARLKPGIRYGEEIHFVNKQGQTSRATAGQFDLQASDGTTLPVYCIDLLNGTLEKAIYHETDWASSPLQSKPKAGPRIKWILEHSFPNVDEGKLGTAAGLGGLTKNDAAAATQVAIWHFSDPDVKVTQRPQDLKAKKLADYLVTEAEKNGDATEPKPTLSLTPASVSGKSGSLLGPITVTSGGGADAIGLTLDKVGAGAGLSLVNKAGAAVKTAHSGDQIYAKVPAGAAAGSAAIEADAEATTSIGRAFVGDDNGEHSQSLILAGGGKVKVNAIASLTWAPKGPIAAATAKVDCTHNGVQVTVTNTGDQDTTVTVTPGKATTVAAGKTVTVLVPVAEDAAYDIKVTGPGLSQEFKGVLNCKTDSTTGSTGTPSGSPTPTPTGSGSTTGGGLAFTGGGGETPIIAGLAGALLLAGGGAVFALRRRGRHGRTSA